VHFSQNVSPAAAAASSAAVRSWSKIKRWFSDDGDGPGRKGGGSGGGGGGGIDTGVGLVPYHDIIEADYTEVVEVVVGSDDDSGAAAAGEPRRKSGGGWGTGDWRKGSTVGPYKLSSVDPELESA
jgi:hypothetical protein